MRTPLRLFLCLFLTGIHLSLYSQAEESLPADRVSIKGTYTLKKIFDLIYRQTKQQVTYANTLLDDRERVTVDVSGTIDEALTVVLAGKAITWVYSEGYVALRERKASVVSVIDPPVVTVRGVVMDEEGNPLPGATVKVKGSAKGVSTGVNGGFTIDIPENSVILVSYTGFEAKEVNAGRVNNLSVSLKKSVSSLDETVVVAYGNSTQRSNTGAITVIKGEQIQSLPNRSFDKSLQGLVPGLQITNGTGQPGGGVSSMVLRGISTGADALAGSTVRNPLIVIDGIPITQDNFQNTVGATSTPVTNPLAQLNPADIESITALRDAAAIALYGSKASNGVILVTTKKGQPGKTVFSYRTQVDFAFLPNRNLRDILNQEEYLEMIYDTYRNTNATVWTDQAIRKDLYNKFPYRVSGTDTSFYPAPDLEKELYQDAATTFSNQISISGGNDKSNFYINFEYTNQNGIVKNTGYDRKSFRINYENKPLYWLTLGTATALSYNAQRLSDGLEGGGTFGSISTLSPLNPIRNENGEYIMLYPWGGPRSNTQNPKAALEYNLSSNIAYRGISKIYGEARFLKYFRFSSSLGIDFMLAEVLEKTDPRFRVKNTNLGSIVDYDRRNANIITTNTLTVKLPSYKKHEIGILLGQEAQIATSREIGGEVKGDSLALPIYDQLTSPRYMATTLKGISHKQTSLSIFGQLNYSYNKKYFLSASIRKDGSSRFGARELWGNYWSVGGGWILTEEPLLNALTRYISFLRFRGSIGISGNSGAVGPSTKFDILTQGTYAGRTSIIMGPEPGNPDIRWEKTFSWNAGLDATLFNDRISLNLDLYNKKTTDLIYGTVLAPVSGFIGVGANIGDIRNTGMEIGISGSVIKRKNWRWNLSASLSKNKNVLIKSNVPFYTLAASNLANEEGRNFNSFYLRRWIGVNPENGKPQWMDADGKEISTYSKAAREFVGKPQPDGFGSFSSTLSYKKIELGIQFYYQYGCQIIYSKMMTLMNDGATPYINQSRNALDYWKQPGDISKNPRRILNNSDGGRNISTRYMLEGDYIKLNNVKLAYSINLSTIERIGIKYLKAFMQGNNLAIWTKLSDQDPDNADLGGGITSPYPNSRTYSIGLQANF